MSVAGNHLNLDNISVQKEQVSTDNELIKGSVMDAEKYRSCLDHGASLVKYNDNGYGFSILDLMGWQLNKERNCLGAGFVYRHAVGRWNDSLIYTYLESTDEKCIGYDCSDESVVRKVETLDLESGEINVLWSGTFEWEKQDEWGNATITAVKHFYLIEDVLYLTLGYDCSEGCSGRWNTGVSFKLDLNNPQEMVYVPIEGQLAIYDEHFYEYQIRSDIGGGGVNYFEEYDLENDEIISEYNIEDNVWSIIHEEKIGEKYFGADLTLFGFSNGKAIFKQVLSNNDSINQNSFWILDLETSQLENSNTEPKLDVSLFKDLSEIDSLLEGFEDDYEIAPIYLKY